MHTTDIPTQQIIKTLSKEWNDFRIVNERMALEKKQKGQADALTVGHLQKLDNSIQEHSEIMQRAYTSIKRPKVAAVDTLQIDEDPQYSKAFCDYLRKGQEQELAALHTKSVLGNDKEAGYNATTRMLKQINGGVAISSPIRRLARVTQIAGDVLELLEDGADGLAGWTQDLDTVLKDTKISQLYKKSIPVHELYAQPKATQRLLEDPIFDVEAWLANKVTDVFVRKESAAFINGDGVGKPRGVLSYDKNKDKVVEVKTGEEGKVNPDAILNLLFSLPEVYAVRAKLLMGREVISALRMLKNPSTGQYLWQPSMAAGKPDTLMGIEVVFSADMPALAADNKIVVYADFEHAYQVVDRGAVRVLRDPYTEKPYTKFYTTKRVGGDLVDCNAMRVLVAS